MLWSIRNKLTPAKGLKGEPTRSNVEEFNGTPSKHVRRSRTQLNDGDSHAPIGVNVIAHHSWDNVHGLILLRLTDDELINVRRYKHAIRVLMNRIIGWKSIKPAQRVKHNLSRCIIHGRRPSCGRVLNLVYRFRRTDYGFSERSSKVFCRQTPTINRRTRRNTHSALVVNSLFRVFYFGVAVGEHDRARRVRYRSRRYANLSRRFAYGTLFRWTSVLTTSMHGVT